MQPADISTLHREASHFHQVMNSAMQNEEVKNEVVMAFLWTEVPKAFSMGIRMFKNGTSARHSMARYIYFFLADKHGYKICQSVMARRFNLHRSNVRRGIEMIRNAHEVKHGYELYVDKSDLIEKNLITFLNKETNG